MLADIKLLLGITDSSKDTLLYLLINMATEEAKLYTRNTSVNDLNTAIVMMVVYNFNRIGTEGLNSEDYSGVSFEYTSDYPESIMRMLNSKKKVVVL